MRTVPVLIALIFNGNAVALADNYPAFSASMPELKGTFDGFYAGIAGGISTAKIEGTVDRSEIAFTDASETFSGDWENGYTASAFVGYNRQFDGFLIGFEADLGLANISVEAYDNDDGSDSTKHELQYVASLRARLGLPLSSRTVLYGTAGLAYLNSEFTARDNRFVDPQTGSKELHSFGYVMGGGAEIALSDSINLRLEGLYYGGMTDHRFDEGELTDDMDAGDYTRIDGFAQVRGGIVINF